MADFATHFILGELALMQPGVDADFINANRTAFNWGLQGPDLLYFYAPEILSHEFHNAATLLHNKDTGGVMYELARYAASCSERNRDMATAYFYGFVCHYALDSLIHPYVNYHARRLREKTSRLHMHAKVESHISASVCAYYKLMTDELRPPAFTADYMASPRLRSTVADMLNAALFECFNFSLPDRKLHAAFFHTFVLEETLISCSSWLRPAAEYVEWFFGSSYILSSNFKCPIPNWDCLNRERRTWHYDDGRAKSTLSVIELMQRAANLSASLIAQYSDMMEQGTIERIPYIRNFGGELIVR